MIRFIYVVAVWVVFVGGVQLYMSHRETIPPPPEFQREAAKGIFSVEITSSSGLEPDPFGNNVSLLVQLDGKVLLQRSDKVEPGEIIRLTSTKVKPLAIAIGSNEFFLDASPALSESNQAHAIRIRIFRDDLVVADKTVWSDPGSKITETIKLAVHSPQKYDPMDHDH